MTAKSVAVEGDVKATAGATPYTGANSGTWTAGPVSYQTYSKLQVNGKPVIFEASCTFNFKGTGPNNAPVAGVETVQLSAGTTTLQKGANNVMKHGDQKISDIYGNKLEVSTSSKLRTA
jgi:hypothetical protein